MNLFTKQWRTLVLSAVLAVGSVCLVGCGDDTGANNGGGGSSINNCTSAEKCKQVTIGTQTWMAENLNIETANSWCYENSAESCAKYGRLYTWSAARSACPSEWHLPTQEEWRTLAKFAGGTGYNSEGGTAGTKLKSKRGWNENGNGTDEYGFSALPGGYRGGDGRFYLAGKYGYWWTATEWGSDNAIRRIMVYGDGGVGEDGIGSGRANGFSVRCVAD